MRSGTSPALGLGLLKRRSYSPHAELSVCSLDSWLEFASLLLWSSTDHKLLGQGKSCHSASPREVKAGPEAETMEDSWFWLPSPGLLSYLCHTAQNNLSKSGITHSALGPSHINPSWRKCSSHNLPTGQPNEGIFSHDVWSSQIIPALSVTKI